MIIAVLTIIGLLVAAGVAVSAKSVRIVREYQRLVLFRLGRAQGIRGPGLVFVNPVVDRVIRVDLREQFLEIARQTAITKDNAPISIDFIIFYKVADPIMTVLQVQNFAAAAQNVAATTLRSVVGDMLLDDVLSKREDMNALLRHRLDETTERWGVKVTNVEVREVNPPAGVQEAMTRQMSAERTRRAQVTEAEGQKQAAVTVAEGAKQAAILTAEGAKQAAILAAEAERQSAVLRAEGLAAGLARILVVAEQLDDTTLQLQYMETLKQVGASASTKIVLPMEVGGVLRGVRDALGASPVEDGAPRRPVDLDALARLLAPFTAVDAPDVPAVSSAPDGRQAVAGSPPPTGAAAMPAVDAAAPDPALAAAPADAPDPADPTG